MRALRSALSRRTSSRAPTGRRTRAPWRGGRPSPRPGPATAILDAPRTSCPSYADWVEALPGFQVFAAAPMIFDGLWMDHYLDTFAGTRVLGGPYTGRQFSVAAGSAFTPWPARCAAPGISEMGHAARAGGMVWRYPPHPPGHRRRARLRQRAGQTVRNNSALPKIEQPKATTDEIHPRLAQGPSRHHCVRPTDRRRR